ncbi:microsomal triglyceride transfer protein, putative, partial [Ixodes scapularis]
INMELIPGGLLKESSVDVSLETPEESLNLLSVGLFAGGLGNVAGGDDGGNDASQEEEEATAGMRLMLMGAELRPYVFFVGTSELMGHVWSGTGSEPTPALQGNLLMMDHFQYVALLNGLVVELKLQGVISLDLTGSIQISLWNRNSHSVVKTRFQTLLFYDITLKGDLADAVWTNHVMPTLQYLTVSKVEGLFVFYLPKGESAACLRMHNVRKHEGVTGRKHLVRTLKKRSQTIAGKSYALHRKNCEYCSIMLAEV